MSFGQARPWWALPGARGDLLVLVPAADVLASERPRALASAAARARLHEWLWTDGDDPASGAILDDVCRHLGVADGRGRSLEEHCREVVAALETGELVLLVEPGPEYEGPAVDVPGRVRVAAAPGSAAASPEEELTFIEIILDDDDGAPVAGQRYRVIDPAGGVHDGRTGPDGRARVDRLKRGDCTILFPDLDVAECRAR